MYYRFGHVFIAVKRYYCKNKHSGTVTCFVRCSLYKLLTQFGKERDREMLMKGVLFDNSLFYDWRPQNMKFTAASMTCIIEIIYSFSKIKDKNVSIVFIQTVNVKLSPRQNVSLGECFCPCKKGLILMIIKSSLNSDFIL